MGTATGGGASGAADNPYVQGGYGGPQQQSPPPPQQVQGFEGVIGGNFQVGSSRPEGDAVFILNLVLRIASLLLALISVAVIASADYKYYVTDLSTGLTFTGDAKPLHVRPYKFVVAIAAIVMFYELVQIILSLVAKGQSRPFTASFWAALLTFVFDHVFGYLMFAAATSAATYADLFRHYGDGTQCSLVGQLCTQVEAGVAMSYLAFATLAVSVLLSGFTFARHIIS